MLVQQSGVPRRREPVRTARSLRLRLDPLGPGHIDEISPRVKGRDPADVRLNLICGLRDSRPGAFAILEGATAIAAFGIVPIPSGSLVELGMAWMTVGEALRDRHRVQLIREARDAFKDLARPYELVVALIDVRCARDTRFAEFLGFRVVKDFGVVGYAETPVLEYSWTHGRSTATKRSRRRPGGLQHGDGVLQRSPD